MSSSAILGPGARVAVIAPAGRFVVEQLQAALNVLREQGFAVVPAPNLWATDRYHAGTIAERQSDLNWALAARDIDAIWLARGGFGCAHLLPGLRPDEYIRKPLLGFSDGTALHAALAATGWLQGRGQLLHAPVVHTLAPTGEQGSLQPVLADGPSRCHLWQFLATGRAESLVGQGAEHAEHLPVRGPVVGGNLTVLASLCGTPWQLAGRGRIVLLEDVAEAPYRLDRSLTQLIASGCLEGALAVGLGEFSGCTATDADGQTYHGVDVLCERLRSLGIPVVRDLPFGHGSRNLAWPYGGVADLVENALKFE